MSGFRIAIIGMTAMAAIALAAVAPAASPQPTDAATNCVDVQIGEDRTAYLNCLNSVFERSVKKERGVPAIEAPSDARSPANRIGIFTESAARQRMGDAFGVSSTPQRPERVFVSPLSAPKPH